LAAEKARIDSLLERQSELIACLGKVTEIGKQSSNAAAAALIDSVRRKIAELGSEEHLSTGQDIIEIMELIGEGSVG
jgi:hypothetical protein